MFSQPEQSEESLTKCSHEALAMHINYVSIESNGDIIDTITVPFKWEN